MVTEVENTVELTNYPSSEDKFDFKAIIVCNYIKIFLASFHDKIFILEYLN